MYLYIALNNVFIFYCYVCFSSAITYSNIKNWGVNLNIFACVAPFRRCLKRFLHQDLLSFLFVSFYLRNKVRIDLD